MHEATTEGGAYAGVWSDRAWCGSDSAAATSAGERDEGPTAATALEGSARATQEDPLVRRARPACASDLPALGRQQFYVLHMAATLPAPGAGGAGGTQPPPEAGS